MQFLRTLFWVVLAVVAVIFAFENWTPVTVRLWSGVLLDTRLPVLLLVVFLVGLLPSLILHRATKWSLGRKLEAAQRNAVLPSEPMIRPEPVPPGGAPIAPPPGVA